ncbi:ATP-binding protein [Psychrobacillus sp. L3]|uniref:ATP-binding protein n=1 Tax=Psychrobacillus sp. L3 TaxID=3236891 RepID=UPI0036F2886A
MMMNMNLTDNDFWEKFGNLRQEDLFFKVHPELIDIVSEVEIKKTECPSCKKDERVSWVWAFDETEYEEPVRDLCRDCELEALSLETGYTLNEKRRAVIDKEWYFINENEASGFKNFEVHDEKSEFAKKTTTEYIKRLLAGEQLNLMMLGKTGTGKSHLSKAIAKTAKHKGKKVAYITAMHLFNKIKGTFNNIHERNRFNEQFKAFDLIVIDDVGMETKKVAEVSWSTSEWTELLNLREGKSNIWTSNFDEQSLSKVIGDRTLSRMYENTIFIENFTGEDFRRRKRINVV